MACGGGGSSNCWLKGIQVLMRVGLYAGRQSGGGFTFETEILCALSELADQSRHKFTLLMPSVEDYSRLQPYIDAKHIDVAILPKIANVVEKKQSFSQQVVAGLRKRLGLKRQPTDQNGKQEKNIIDSIEKLAHAHGIQVIWFVDQTYEYIPDIPYLATLWDLQHRLQPFFPEVSEGGIWDRREKGLSQYLQRAAVVIAGSQTATSEIERFYQVPVERIKVLPHPTPKFALNSTVLNDSDILSKYGISSGYLFYPAQFWAHKNHINLLLALSLLREKYSLALNMVFVGSNRGNEAYVRQKIQELDLTSQVKILGFVPQSDLIVLYRHALALTYVTFFGPDNLPPLEAFALGCPVVASEVSGAKEQLGDAALLVNPADPEDIMRAIRKIWKNSKLRTNLIQRGRQRAICWTSDDFVRGVFEILDGFEPFRRNWA